MALWHKSSSDGSLSAIETIRLSTYELPHSVDDKKYKSEMFSENGAESLGYYATQEDAVAGHAALCDKYGLKQ